MGRKQILVVDDDAMVLDAVRMALTFYGYAVETASSAAEALQKLPGACFDVVVTDLKMPGMIGSALASEIKKRQPALPVILLTGYPPEVRPAGVDKVLLKPFSTLDLYNAVVSLAEQGNDKDDLPSPRPSPIA